MKSHLKLVCLALLAGVLALRGGTTQNGHDSPTPEGKSLTVVRAVPPQIPNHLLLGWTGQEKAILEFVVNSDGRVIRARVLVTHHPELKPYLLEAIRAWEFAPAPRGAGKDRIVRMPMLLEGMDPPLLVAKN